MSHHDSDAALRVCRRPGVPPAGRNRGMPGFDGPTGTAGPVLAACGPAAAAAAGSGPHHLQVAQVILRNIEEYWKWLIILMNIDTY